MKNNNTKIIINQLNLFFAINVNINCEQDILMTFAEPVETTDKIFSKTNENLSLLNQRVCLFPALYVNQNIQHIFEKKEEKNQFFQKK